MNSSTFTYPPLNTQLNGQTIWILLLHANNYYCNGNSGGADILKYCPSPVPPADEWVLDPSNRYFVNIGRSNDEDNWEILCNPGGGGQLEITTRNSCTTYHEQWNFAS